MNILILYATNSGGTQLVSEYISALLKQKKYSVVLQNVHDSQATDIAKYDLVFLGSCTWNDHDKEGQLPTEFKKFIEKTSNEIYEGKKFCVYALGDTSYTYFAQAADHLVEFITEKKGILVGQPLKIDGYMFKKTFYNKKIEEWIDSLPLG